MASKGDRDSSSKLEGLWDLDLGDDEDIPPALDPRARPGAITVRPEADDRDTVLPPLPQPDYVQRMMALGELDDLPDDDDTRRTAARRPAAADPPAAARGLGLVVAKENELLLPSDAQRGRTPGAAAAHAVTSHATPPGGPLARSGGFRPASTSMPTGRNIPTPRAPSIPPEEDDPLAGLEFFDQLSSESAPRTSLDSLDDRPPGVVIAPAAQSEVNARATRRRTPNPTPAPDPAHSPTNAGLRLRKSATPVDTEGGRMSSESAPRTSSDRPTPAPSSAADNVRAMLIRFDAKNYGGALVLAESVLTSDPSNAVARQTAERCREMLAEKYLSSLGGRASIPHVAMPPEELRWLSLDHRAGFLLSFIDGATPIEEVLDASSMPELEALRIMFELRQQGVIDVQTPPKRAGRK